MIDFLLDNEIAVTISLTAIMALSPLLFKIASFVRSEEKGDANSIVSPRFFSLRGYKILAVHQYEQSDDVSGYKHLGQNSRKDQWEKLIRIERRFRCFYRIAPIDPSHILTVVISRDSKEKWRTVFFNK